MDAGRMEWVEWVAGSLMFGANSEPDGSLGECFLWILPLVF